ncbi:MAG: hypothetical protein K5841_04290 [Fretibacterium sp.]|nr:hypothetical protein [Fretibacterium sp.]
MIQLLEEAGAGSPDELYRRGIQYVTGDGVETDEKKGIELLRRAAEHGHQKAKDALKLFE